MYSNNNKNTELLISFLLTHMSLIVIKGECGTIFFKNTRKLGKRSSIAKNVHHGIDFSENIS